MILIPRIIDARVLSNDQVNIGIVTRTLLEAEGRRLVALLIKPGPFKRSRILVVSDIAKVGDDKIILAEGSLLARKKDPRFRPLLRPGTSLIGRKVASSKGKDLGKVRLAKYKLEDGTLESISISKNAFVTFTRGSYIVEGKDILSFTGSEIEVKAEKLIKASSKLTEQMSTLGTKMFKLKTEAEGLVSSRERSFIIGKTSSYDITDETGDKVIEKGDIITADHISRATEAKRLHHLTLAAGTGGIRSRFQKWKDKH